MQYTIYHLLLHTILFTFLHTNRYYYASRAHTIIIGQYSVLLPVQVWPVIARAIASAINLAVQVQVRVLLLPNMYMYEDGV